ncbi:maleylpyruvate isomerase family mycothiol-dependent enzyme [Nonomuraea glycinis]|nr:maleylpyruvate isomerase N-terminal domain-containing protein [Nonomuraea glycinis]MCA2177180.1 maleylpyruvate isomerase family mycothiol-dependent enzyme [Nonomuraea glycinis]
MTVLQRLLAEMAAANDRLLATAASLSDADVLAPSRLPGWSRGHVLVHVARNADSHLNLLTWARTGIVTPQYPSMAVRERQIESRAALPAAELIADIEDSVALARRVRPQGTARLPPDVGARAQHGRRGALHRFLAPALAGPRPGPRGGGRTDGHPGLAHRKISGRGR